MNLKLLERWETFLFTQPAALQTEKLPTFQQREAKGKKRYFKENVFFNCFSSFPKELLRVWIIYKQLSKFVWRSFHLNTWEFKNGNNVLVSWNKKESLKINTMNMIWSDISCPFCENNSEVFTIVSHFSSVFACFSIFLLGMHAFTYYGPFFLFLVSLVPFYRSDWSVRFSVFSPYPPHGSGRLPSLQLPTITQHLRRTYFDSADSVGRFLLKPDSNKFL